MSHSHADPHADHSAGDHDMPVSLEHPTVIVGAGLAGLAAAVRLAEAGVPVTLVETRGRLGGRATSFEDPETGDLLDNCQHVLLKACTSLIDFYDRLGVSDQIAWSKELHFAYRDPADPDGPAIIDTLEGDDLPAPMHLTRSMLGFKGLGWGQKLAIARGMLAILQVSRRGRGLYADQSFADFLAELNQPADVIEKFWEPVVVSAANAALDRVAASYAIQVFQEGFLATNDGYQMGLPTVPLEALYGSARGVIEHAGGRVLTSSSAESFVFEGGRVTGLKLADGQELAGASFVSAVPFDRLGKLATGPMKAADARLSRLDEIRATPIIGIHLYVSPTEGVGPVMGLPHLTLCGSPLHWVFNKGAVSGGEHADTQHLHGVISAADDLVDLPAEDLVDLAFAELTKAMPAFETAELVHCRVIKEKRATFALVPGVDALRPGTVGAIENLLLAGDWVDTGWPATMEGAVRSGYAAAAAVLEAAGARDANTAVPEQEPSLLYELVSG